MLLTKWVEIQVCGMELIQTLFNGATSMSLQFGGGLIELAIVFLVLAVVAMVLGASGIAGVSMDIAKWLVIIFVALAIITFVL